MTPQSSTATPRAPSIGFHNICSADQLLNRMQVLQDQTAMRASELAQARGQSQGYSQGDWAQAKSEFLRPVPVEVEDYAGTTKVRAIVLGFEEDELRVSIEPARIIIAGKKEQQPEQGNKLFYIDWCPDEILEAVKLPEDIDPALAKITLHSGTLEFELFKAVEWPEWSLEIMDG